MCIYCAVIKQMQLSDFFYTTCINPFPSNVNILYVTNSIHYKSVFYNVHVYHIRWLGNYFSKTVNSIFNLNLLQHAQGSQKDTFIRSL